MVDLYENLKEVTTKLPTFLAVLLPEDSSIKLVYYKKNEVNSEKLYIKNEKIENCNETSVISELELTGTPLMTDLGGNDSICTDVIPMIPPSWTAEEAKYYPLSLKKARTFLNIKLNKHNESIHRPTYCLCDGNDERNTVALRVMTDEDNLMRTVIHVLPCHNETDEITTLEYMKKDHIFNVGRNITNIKVQFFITKCYYLWGYNLKNCTSLQNAEHNGSVAVEVSTTETEGKNIQNSKMTLQAIVGHNDSPLKLFWEELTLIHSYMNLLANTKQLMESQVISNSNLHCDEIILLLGDLLTSNVNCFKREMCEKLDLENLRQESVLDKLWHILKYCRNLSDLRDCLHFFFEELLEIQTKVQILSDDTSTIAEIITGIVDGRTAVPSLSFTQCLELLMDLGLEKLKNDYLTIINNFCTFAKEPVMRRWRDLCSENLANLGPIMKRKSRISINPKSSITDLSKSRLKFLYLNSMHKVVELMFLFKENVKFSEEGFDHFCEAVCNHFIISDQNVGILCNINEPKLCEFTFNFPLADNSIMEEVSPATRSVRMTSNIEGAEVTTVFYFSEYPIFPPSVFNNYEISFDNSNVKSLYVTKLVKYFGNC